jgi:hypothetical protein
MTIDFEALLTNDQKRGLLEQRIAQFAAEGYQHELNKSTAQATGDEQAEAACDAAIAAIVAAIELHTAKLKALPAAE